MAMIYKILHKIFGWDYIWWQNSCDSGVARIHRSPDGTVWYWQYKSTKLAKTILGTHHRIIWLTCKPEKYILESSKLREDNNGKD